MTNKMYNTSRDTTDLNNVKIDAMIEPYTENSASSVVIEYS
jgi:hypothetical protein